MATESSKAVYFGIDLGGDWCAIAASCKKLVVQAHDFNSLEEKDKWMLEQLRNTFSIQDHEENIIVLGPDASIRADFFLQLCRKNGLRNITFVYAAGRPGIASGRLNVLTEKMIERPKKHVKSMFYPQGIHKLKVMPDGTQQKSKVCFRFCEDGKTHLYEYPEDTKFMLMEESHFYARLLHLIGQCVHTSQWPNDVRTEDNEFLKELSLKKFDF